MRLAGEIVWWVLFVYIWMIIIRAVSGWLPVRWPKPVRSLLVVVYDLTEPVLAPIRRFIPIIPLGSGMGLDISPMVAMVVIVFLQWLVRELMIY